MAVVCCNCPHPPGGRVQCESHQMAFCIIENKATRSGCVNPPHYNNYISRISNAYSTVTWAFSNIVDREPIHVEEFEELTDQNFFIHDWETYAHYYQDLYRFIINVLKRGKLDDAISPDEFREMRREFQFLKNSFAIDKNRDGIKEIYKEDYLRDLPSGNFILPTYVKNAVDLVESLLKKKGY